MRKPIKRKKLLLAGEPVQLKILAFLMVSMLVPLILVGGCLYFLIFNIMAEQLGIPEYIAINLVPVINKINAILLVVSPLLLALLFVWGAIISHRIAGPLERLQREVEEIAAAGDFHRRIRVRKHDDIRRIADAINKLLAKASEGRSK